MRCPKCQAENADDAAYCSLCYARFQVQLRSHEVDEAARRMGDTHQGAMLRCPSCRSFSPLDSQFCLKCGFVFEDLESLMVTREEVEREGREREEARKREAEVLVSEPIVVEAGSDGAAVMRSIEDVLDKGYRARVHTRGRDATTYAMKLLALLAVDLRNKDREMTLKVHLTSEGAVTYLEDVELEIVVDAG